MTTLALMFPSNPIEIAIIAGLVLVLFGGSKIKDTMRGMGEGIREFKKASRDDEPEEKPDTKKTDDNSKASSAS